MTRGEGICLTRAREGGGGQLAFVLLSICCLPAHPPPLPLLLPADMREQYCQLWCALFANDRAAATEAAVNLGGARAGQILPVILTQRARNK